ncbi:MAG: alpha/beta hydrolase [bacterium]|nr:alpha/beta hydrolase [bacterium]
MKNTNGPVLPVPDSRGTGKIVKKREGSSRMFLLLPAFLLFFFIWAWLTSDFILFPRRDYLNVTPAQYGLAFEKIKFTTSDGLRINGFFIPAEKASGTIIVLHGQEDNKSEYLGVAAMFHRHHYNTLLFDFRAHGWTKGYCTLGALEVRDLDSAIDYLFTRPEIDKQKIGVIGFSMGAATAIAGTAKNSLIKAVAADSSFRCLKYIVPRYARIFYHIPFPFLMVPGIWMAELRADFRADEADALRYIDQISPRPVFLIGGEKDIRVPPENQELLFRKAGEPKQKWIVPGAGHVDAFESRPAEYEKKVAAFFDRYLK